MQPLVIYEFKMLAVELQELWSTEILSDHPKQKKKQEAWVNGRNKKLKKRKKEDWSIKIIVRTEYNKIEMKSFFYNLVITHKRFINFLIPLLAWLFNVFHVVDHTIFPFCSYCHLSSPCWLELLDNFIFLSSWRFSKWSFLVCWMSFDNFTVPSVVCEFCNMSCLAELLLLVVQIHILPLCSQITSEVLMHIFYILISKIYHVTITITESLSKKTRLHNWNMWVCYVLLYNHVNNDCEYPKNEFSMHGYLIQNIPAE